MISEKLRNFMFENNLTQNDVANRIGVTQKTVSNWLRGVGEPNKQQLETLGMNDIDKEEPKDSIVMSLLKRLIEEKIIEDENNIDQATLDLLVAAIKNDIKIIKKTSNE